MYKNVLNESKESETKGLLKLNSKGDVVRVKGLDNVNLECYDSDGNYVGKVLAIREGKI